MHEQRPSQTDGEYQPPPPFPPPKPKAKGWRNAGGTAAGIGLLAAKFKTLLAFLLTFKWIFLGGKFLLSFGSIFASIWFYALFYGWKLGIVIVLLVLVHEIGHWLAFRAFGTPVSLPYFIPGFAAFVAPKAPPPSPAHGAFAALMGPITGMAASGVCFAYGVATNNHFWFAAAYIGFFLNLFQLIPLVPFDGGRVAEIIDARLFWVGLVVFALFLAVIGLHSPFAWLLLLIVGVTALPRIRAALRGEISPVLAATPVRARVSLALGYFMTIAVGAIGAGVTMSLR